MSNVDMKYPGLSTENKVYLYNTICRPTLLFASECLALSNKYVDNMQKAQGYIVKQVCGLSKRSHHSALLDALDTWYYLVLPVLKTL